MDSLRWTLQPGTRVRVRVLPHVLTLTNDRGVLSRRGAYDGYWIVRLDEPAAYDNDVVRCSLNEVLVAEDNLDVMESE